MLQDLLAPFWFLNAHIILQVREINTCISTQQNQKRQQRGI